MLANLRHAFTLLKNHNFKQTYEFLRYYRLSLGEYYRLIDSFRRIEAGEKIPFHVSADISNSCNLKCRHCYWWKNRKEDADLTADQWRQIIKDKIKGSGVITVMLAGGEPMTRRDLIKVFVEELPNKVVICTNGTLKLEDFGKFLAYVISIDGPERVHNYIRQMFGEAINPHFSKKAKPNVYETIKKNIEDYKDETDKWNISIAMTINSLNHKYVEEVAEEWHKIVNVLSFQFHTPFSKNDKLWIPYGRKKDEIVNRLLVLKKKYGEFVSNTEKSLEFLKTPWGGEGTRPTNCPTWAVIALDNRGRIKDPCCVGSAHPDFKKPICENCGTRILGVYLGLTGDPDWIPSAISFRKRMLQRR